MKYHPTIRVERCAHCMKRKGLHQAVTLACPVGTRTRIGFLDYSKTKTYKAK